MENVKEKVTAISVLDIMKASWAYMPDIIKNEWRSIETCNNTQVIRTWIKDIVKPEILQSYENLRQPEIQKFEQTNQMRGDTLTILGMIEIYLYQKGAPKNG